MHPYKSRSGRDGRGHGSTENLLGKTLPANLDAERSVIGAILLNDENLTQVCDYLEPSDFYAPAHQILFQACLSVSQKNKRIDVLTLQHELESTQQLEAIGGVSYLLELQENIPSIGLIVQHATIVKEKRILRELISSSTEIIAASYDESNTEIDRVLDQAEKKIFQISNRRVAPTFVQLDVWLNKTFQHLAQIRGLREGVTGVPSGFGKFDEMTSGMQRGDLLILAGRPSMGKTLLAMNMVANAARESFNVGVFSLEMSAEQLVLRMLSSESGIPLQRIRNATINSDEWNSLTNAAAALAEYKIFIEDTAGLSIMELRAKARKLKAKGTLDLLVIDYLQLITGNVRYENRTQEISEISRSLKGLAKELDIPVLALSQLSRQLESRLDKRPMLSDLRESGAIEQDADVVFFIYRDSVYNPDTETPDLSEIIVGKQRNGPIGTVHVRFQNEHMRFEDFTNEYGT